MTLHLDHYETGSVIRLEYHGVFGKFADLTYTRNIHNFESETDYSRLVTEWKTYGDNAMLEEYTRLQDKKLNELRLQLEEIK